MVGKSINTSPERQSRAEHPAPIAGPDRIGQAAVTYAPTAQLLTKPTGFMDAYELYAEPVLRLLVWLYLLLCSLFQPRR